MNKKFKVQNTQQTDFLQNLEFLVNTGEGFHYSTVIKKNKNCSRLRLWPNRLSTHGIAQKTTNSIGDKTSKKLSCSEISVSNGGQQKSNWQTYYRLSMWLKTTSGAQVPAVCEKTFSTYFCSPASGKYNLLKYYWHQNIATLNFYLIL